jgi:hypothetical protein
MALALQKRVSEPPFARMEIGKPFHGYHSGRQLGTSDRLYVQRFE